VKEGAANWDVITHRYFDTVEKLDLLSKADEFLSEVIETKHSFVLDCYVLVFSLKQKNNSIV